MKLYNTLTRKVEEIRPLNPPLVTIYTCGPTVYDYAHIGHWFTYIRADMLVRTLKLSGLTPRWVMNITDVGHLVSDADDGEDKLEKGARREGKTAWEVADYYTHDFLAGMETLNLLTPDHIVKATDHIAEQIDLIKRLEKGMYTYTIDDGVYYDTSKFEDYAAFARLDLDELQCSGRVAVNPQKHNSSDFALWKFSIEGTKRDMEWDSPWGKGFPGWHVECSAMSMKYLGETLDIHTGGIDHIPVHHTNEIAQSESVTGKRFANIWMHSNHVMVNGDKISKSLGNGVRLQEVIERGISSEAVRLNVLESNYRSQSKFTWKSLEAAQHRLQTYRSMADNLWQTQTTGQVSEAQIVTTKQQMLAALTDDLNTPIALSILSQLETAIGNDGISTDSQETFASFLLWLDEALGLKLSGRPDLDAISKKLLVARHQARQAQDWTTSDELRDQLKAQGIVVRDSAQHQIWSRF